MQFRHLQVILVKPFEFQNVKKSNFNIFKGLTYKSLHNTFIY